MTSAPECHPAADNATDAASMIDAALVAVAYRHFDAYGAPSMSALA